MVIEHTFVTTLEAPQTMQAAMQFLASRGFEQPDQSAFPIGGQWETLEMRRGRKKAAKAKSIAELPQVAHVQWDRGRVTVALSIEPSYTWGGQSATGFHVGTATGNPKKMKVHAQMLSAIATGLEQLLVRGVEADTAAQQWDAADEEARRLARRRRRRNWIIAGVVFALLAAMVTLVVMTAK